MLNRGKVSLILSDSHECDGSIVSTSASSVIDFEKNGGVIPVVTVNHTNGRVLMLAYMNREAFDETVATGPRMLLLALAQKAMAQGRGVQELPGGARNSPRLR